MPLTVLWPALTVEEVGSRKQGMNVMGALGNGESRVVVAEPAELAGSTAGFTGRGWVFDEADAWLARGERRFLLTGDAGTGKSTVAARLVAFSRGEPPSGRARLEKGFLSAAHFCRAREDRSLDPLRVFEHIALQLATGVPRFREALFREAEGRGVTVSITGTATAGHAVESEVTGVRIGMLDLAGLSAREAFDRCLRRPLESLYAERSEPVVILIDALDEALSYQARPNLVEALRRATDATGELPEQVRFLFTSRPDPRATTRIADRTLDLIADAPADVDDVREYAERQLDSTALSSGERPRVAKRVADAGHGNFLYARYVIAELVADPERLSDPGTLALPDGLDGHYREFLERELATDQGCWSELYRPLLGMLAVARDRGLTASELAGAARLNRSTVDDALRVLSQYLSPPAGEGRLRLYHQSFREFLLDGSDYPVYPEEVSEALARYFLNEYGDDWLGDEPCDGSRAYALAETPGHLTEAVRLAERRDARRRRRDTLVELLLNPEFIEAKTSRLGIDSLLRDLHTAVAVAESDELALERRVLDREASTLRHWDRHRHPEYFWQQVLNRAIALGAEAPAKTARSRLAQIGKSYLELVWSATRESPQLERVLEGHTDTVFAVALTDDGRAVSASSDHTLRVWDLTPGSKLHRLEGHTASVTAVALTDDGRVVSASADHTLGVWGLENGSEIHRLEGHTDWVDAVALSGDGRVVSASADRTLRVWDLDTGSELRRLEGHTDRVPAVASTGDGRVVSASWDRTLRVWDLDAGSELRRLEGHIDAITAVVLSADGRAVSASSDLTLRVWDLDAGTELQCLEGHTLTVNAVALTGDGRAVSASSDHTLRVWDLDAGTELHRLEGHTAPVFAVASTDDGRAVSASMDHTLRVWDLDTGSKLHRLEGHTDTVYAVALSGDGRAVSASRDRTLRVWDLDTGAEQTIARLTAYPYASCIEAADGLLITADGGITCLREIRALRA